MVGAVSRNLYKSWVIDALKELGPTRPTQVYEWIRENRGVPASELDGVTSDGENLFEKNVRWARKDLFDEGFVISPDRGIWDVA